MPPNREAGVHGPPQQKNADSFYPEETVFRVQKGRQFNNPDESEKEVKGGRYVLFSLVGSQNVHFPKTRENEPGQVSEKLLKFVLILHFKNLSFAAPRFKGVCMAHT